MCYNFFMRKILLLLFLVITTVQIPAQAVSFGQYKPETEYGLIDGFKFNFGKKDENGKLIEIKSETKEEKQRLEREKLKPVREENNEYEIFRFMQQNTVPF